MKKWPEEYPNISCTYRAWNTETKRMIYIEGKFSGINRTYITISEDGWSIIFDNSEDELKILATHEDSILMEYIGIESIDKKEKTFRPLFGGDIVRHDNGYLYYVDWSPLNGWWCLMQPRITTEEDGREVNMPLERAYTGGINGQEIKCCRIVGNIYENPELMEKVEDGKET